MFFLNSTQNTVPRVTLGRVISTKPYRGLIKLETDVTISTNIFLFILRENFPVEYNT